MNCLTHAHAVMSFRTSTHYPDDTTRFDVPSKGASLGIIAQNIESYCIV